MRIHREGFLIVLITTLVCLGIIFGSQNLFPHAPVATQIASVIALILFVLVLQFFRNPLRYTHAEDHEVFAPADGKVVVIEEVEETEYFHDKRIQVSIFMSPFNVHVNRNPIGGLVRFYRYHPGKYLAAWLPKSSTDNERTTIVIKDQLGREVLFRQIAGALARRIRCYVQEGDRVREGKEMGFIKFGSRVDIFLPVGTEILVKLNEKTRGGESVIAKLNS
ncbi:MAG: phosphatidylserine decarboxylase family protein [Bacteroidetes bacterium]|nr:MAG: phosphatidylserine decarboxylase family protein [Bacteroidota bacterium]